MGKQGIIVCSVMKISNNNDWQSNNNNNKVFLYLLRGIEITTGEPRNKVINKITTDYKSERTVTPRKYNKYNIKLQLLTVPSILGTS